MFAGVLGPVLRPFTMHSRLMDQHAHFCADVHPISTCDFRGWNRKWSRAKVGQCLLSPPPEDMPALSSLSPSAAAYRPPSSSYVRANRDSHPRLDECQQLLEPSFSLWSPVFESEANFISSDFRLLPFSTWIRVFIMKPSFSLTTLFVRNRILIPKSIF